MIIRNPYYEDSRVKSLKTAAAAFKLKMQEHSNVETFTAEQALANCPELEALKPLKDGEIDLICKESGAEIIHK